MLIVGNLKTPDSSENQAECVSSWLQKQQEEQFLDLVTVHKKKVIGFFAGQFEDTHLDIIWMKAETTEILNMLWNKVKQTHEFDSAGLSTGDPALLETLGFKSVLTVMQYQTEQTEMSDGSGI